MYNSEIPQDIQLPSSSKLIKSTALALASAAFILVTCILPAEYAIDPTGIGNVLGLTKMGEIKQSLKAENTDNLPIQTVGTIGAGNAVPVSTAEPVAEILAVRKDSISIDLQPGQATEVKLSMPKDASVNYEWRAEGGGVNFDTHGDAVGVSYHGYGKGRNETRQQGTLIAAFDGKHGWFWRNRTENPVKVVLSVEGQFREMKKVL